MAYKQGHYTQCLLVSEVLTDVGRYGVLELRHTTECSI
jgi:hypothetical protein